MKIFETLFFVFFISLSSYAQLDQSLALARAKDLENSRAWKKLLHIEPNIIGVSSTQITDEKFYLSNLPKYRDMDELSATLHAFFEPAEKFARLIDDPLKKTTTSKVLDHSEHAICRFPARLKYLKDTLSNPNLWSTLPQVQCLYQNIFLESLNPKSVSYVFSSYYSDSPGSAFGHTFFRVNRQSESTRLRQELLDYGMGFAANVTVSNPAAYAVLGLVGGFTGGWTNLPYYYKVREYNDFEARDLWSYDLNLTPDEIQMFALHMWEIGGHSYTYYFFTQNCSFHMLTALEAAAPRLHLIEHVPFYYVIPSDSLKALFYEKGLVKNISFRSSTRQVFLERTNRLNTETLSEFQNYAKNEILPASLKSMSNESRALFLDAAIDLGDLRHPQIDVKTQSDLYQKRERLLSERALVNFISPEVILSKDTQQRPDEAHGSSRIGLIYSQKDLVKSGFFQYRFALHDLLDPQYGMPKNSQLEFFNLNFQALPQHLKFQDMNLFKVFNLSPINFFENQASWGFELGIQNKSSYCPPENQDCFLNGFTGKYGRSINVLNENYFAWGLLTVNGRYGAKLYDSKYYLAPGFEFGLLARIGNQTSLLGTFSREYPVDREYNQNYNVEIRQSFYNKIGLSLKIFDDSVGSALYYYY